MSGSITPPAAGAEASVGDLLGLLTAYQASAAVVAATRVGLFDALDPPADPAAVAARLGCDRGAIGSLLEALVGLGLVRVEAGGRYRTTEVAARLGRDGDLRLVVEKEAFFAAVWLDLAETVRTGRPRLEPWPVRLGREPEHAREFLAALVVLAELSGVDLVSLCGLAPGTRVVDLGGGLGSHAVPLARAGVDVVVVDLPQVVAWAGEAIESSEAALRDRIHWVGADLLAPEVLEVVGTGYDVALLSHVLHDLDDDGARVALGVAHASTRSGGSVVVVEIPGDAAPPTGPMFDLMMRVETPGRARSLRELHDLLGAVGFVEMREVPGVAPPQVVLQGLVP